MPIRTSKQLIRAEIQHMAKKDILRMIPDDVLSRIKSRDPNPTIYVFGIGETGSALGSVVGAGQRAFRYVQHAIQGLFRNLNYGTKVFENHAETNSHEGRVAIGEVVGKSVEAFAESARSLAAVYIYPEFSESGYDVASIEAEFEGYEDESGNAVVDSIRGVSGIALGKSSEGTIPGFPGSTLVGAVQAFATQSTVKEDEAMPMSKDELRKAMKEAGIAPEDLVEKKEAAPVPDLSGLKPDEIARQVADILNNKSKPEPRKEARTSQSADEMTVELNKYRLGDVVTSLKDERKLTDAEVKFILQKKGNFTSKAGKEDMEALKKDVNGFIDSQLEELKSVREALGLPAQEKTAPDIDTPATDGGKAAKGETVEKYNTDPKTNPLIPED